jgi:hypothetical protein
MNKANRFSPAVRERAVRLVQEHRGRVPVAVGSGGVDCTQDWVLGVHAAGLGQAG